ncbi:uncharacterized protein MCYG_07610 [Microsporum canis CBS 113480]|uniref:Uncharacterized protein n=1 Tax=Arthroderma otae (strain ATCC MYA-4605 / CBS 113480) TaxID=554155 RepID=C5FWV1_ARTOC|nr:uncharacterized protein MCYG_07610 [Microsporum canis CBS 113480]EEQ34791.1 predicted protein [Microsporum canis CBS 113480]
MKFNLVLLATFLAAPILATTIPEVSEAIDLADREMSAVDEGNELTARKAMVCRTNIAEREQRCYGKCSKNGCHCTRPDRGQVCLPLEDDSTCASGLVHTVLCSRRADFGLFLMLQQHIYTVVKSQNMSSSWLQMGNVI